MLVEAAGLRWRAFAVATARETAAELMRAAMFAELVVGRAREAECAGKRRTNFPSSRHLERRRSTKLISRSQILLPPIFHQSQRLFFSSTANTLLASKKNKTNWCSIARGCGGRCVESAW